MNNASTNQFLSRVNLSHFRQSEAIDIFAELPQLLREICFQDVTDLRRSGGKNMGLFLLLELIHKRPSLGCWSISCELIKLKRGESFSVSSVASCVTAARMRSSRLLFLHLFTKALGQTRVRSGRLQGHLCLALRWSGLGWINDRKLLFLGS